MQNIYICINNTCSNYLHKQHLQQLSCKNFKAQGHSLRRNPFKYLTTTETQISELFSPAKYRQQNGSINKINLTSTFNSNIGMTLTLFDWKNADVRMQTFLKCDYSSRKEVKSLLALLIITVIGDVLTTHCSPTNIYDTTSQTNHHCTAQLTEYLKTFLYPHSNVSTVLSATVILHLFTLTLANAISNTTVHDPVSYIGSTFCIKTSVIRQLIHREYLTLILLTWRIGWVPNNASKWQIGI